MKVKEIQAKNVLIKSKLPETYYTINPYIGCQHACVYCYSRFMKRFTNHREDWGDFVDVKINAPKILEGQLEKAKKKMVLLSSVCDPYQPLEKKYKITRRILEKLVEYQFSISILTKSDLVLRDLDLSNSFLQLILAHISVSIFFSLFLRGNYYRYHAFYLKVIIISLFSDRTQNINLRINFYL